MKTIYLMNLVTGSVDTRENWLSEMQDWEVNQDGLTPQQQFESLVEVVLDENNNWVEAETEIESSSSLRIEFNLAELSSEEKETFLTNLNNELAENFPSCEIEIIDNERIDSTYYKSSGIDIRDVYPIVKQCFDNI